MVVHSIKKHMWFLETATVLLEGDDYTEKELMEAMARPHGSVAGSGHGHELEHEHELVGSDGGDGERMNAHR